MKEVIAGLLGFTGLNKEEIENLVEIPKESALGDYAFPCFVLASKLKKNPNEIAKELAEKIDWSKSKDFEKIEAQGPYVNFFVDRATLAGETIGKISKEGDKYGSTALGKSKIMVEFSQPNTHKAFHVGHVRGTSLGESIARILEFEGERVVRANYSGDTGMHIAKWLWNYYKNHKKEKITDEESWFANIYVGAVQRLEDDEEAQKEAEELNRKLDSRDDKEINELWSETRKHSIKSWDKIYHELNTGFDAHFFESELEERGKEIVKDLVKKNIAETSDGAVIIDFKKFKKESLGVLVLIRKDGTILYGGKDLALAERKFNEFVVDKSIYVVGKAQDLYMNQLFEILELMRSETANKTKYVSFNEIRLPWGKMSSRTGENVLYSDFKKQLIEYAVKEIEKRYKLNNVDLYDRALAIVIASMKYAMLKQDTNKNIIFDPKEAVSFEGDTGPYLLYSYARSQSILKKANYNKNKKIEEGEIDDFEKRLVSVLASFPEIVSKAYQNLDPSKIANYSYQLARTFSEFYHNVQVIGSKREQFRLRLVESFGQVMKNSLHLLGINVIREM